MYVGKIKYRDQRRAEDRANTLDRGGGADHMTSTLDRGGCAENMADILRRSDHADDRVQREFAAQTRDSVHRALRGATRWCATL